MRIPDDILKCVCFLCVRTMDRGREVFKFGGTGFFISVPSEERPDETNYIYLITAKHNVEKSQPLGELFLRMNTTDGGARFVEVNIDWHYSDNEASDVAVMAWAPPSEFQYRHLHVDMSATNDVLKEHGIGIGDELSIAGLFSQRHGAQRNLPIVRTGIIAGMPDEPLIDDESGLEYHAYLAEVRSIGGLSGSPVFVVLEPGRALAGKIDLSRKIFLLGLIRGHWDYRYRDAPVDFAREELDAVNMGIAIVTPIQDALAIINSDDLVKARRAEDKQLLKEEAATKDAET